MSRYRPDNGFEGLMGLVRQELNEADKPKPATTPAPQNMRTVEEPVVEPEELGVEDYSEEDLNATPAKPAPKSKSKDDDRYKIREVPDKEVQNPVPKKESKGALYLCNNCFKTFRANEAICSHCRSNIVEAVVQEAFDPQTISRFGTPPDDDTGGSGSEKGYACPKCKGRFSSQELGRGQTCPDCDVPVKVMRESKVVEGADRTEEVANAILHGLQPLDYWHTETVPSAAGTHYEFITTDGPKIKAYIEKPDPDLPEGTSVKEAEVTEGGDRSEEIANAIAAALQPLEYWHTETQQAVSGTHYEFITTSGPKVKVFIEKGASAEPE